MNRVHLSRRLTHRYRDGWAHLDQWQALPASVNVTPARRFIDPNDWESYTFVQHTRLPAGLSRRQRQDLVSALCDQLSGSGCRHEHDCCGCVSYYASAKFVSARDLVITTRATFNY